MFWLLFLGSTFLINDLFSLSAEELDKKIVICVLIEKGGDRKCLGNYQEVSIFPEISKEFPDTVFLIAYDNPNQLELSKRLSDTYDVPFITSNNGDFIRNKFQLGNGGYFMIFDRSGKLVSITPGLWMDVKLLTRWYFEVIGNI